jgi:hypothetical protein
MIIQWFVDESLFIFLIIHTMLWIGFITYMFQIVVAPTKPGQMVLFNVLPITVTARVRECG